LSNGWKETVDNAIAYYNVYKGKDRMSAFATNSKNGTIINKNAGQGALSDVYKMAKNGPENIQKVTDALTDLQL